MGWRISQCSEFWLLTAIRFQSPTIQVAKYLADLPDFVVNGATTLCTQAAVVSSSNLFATACSFRRNVTLTPHS